MNIFKTKDGRPHQLRIVAALYTIALIPGCNLFHDVGPLCWLRIVGAIGWWLYAWGVPQDMTWRDLRTSRRILGVALVLGSIAGQFFVTGQH